MKQVINRTIISSQAQSYIQGVISFAKTLGLAVQISNIRERNYLWIFRYQVINIVVEGNQYDVENFIINI